MVVHDFSDANSRHLGEVNAAVVEGRDRYIGGLEDQPPVRGQAEGVLAKSIPVNASNRPGSAVASSSVLSAAKSSSLRPIILAWSPYRLVSAALEAKCFVSFFEKMMSTRSLLKNSTPYGWPICQYCRLNASPNFITHPPRPKNSPGTTTAVPGKFVLLDCADSGVHSTGPPPPHSRK